MSPQSRGQALHYCSGVVNPRQSAVTSAVGPSPARHHDTVHDSDRTHANQRRAQVHRDTTTVAANARSGVNPVLRGQSHQRAFLRPTVDDNQRPCTIQRYHEQRHCNVFTIHGRIDQRVDVLGEECSSSIRVQMSRCTTAALVRTTSYPLTRKVSPVKAYRQSVGSCWCCAGGTIIARGSKPTMDEGDCLQRSKACWSTVGDFWNRNSNLKSILNSWFIFRSRSNRLHRSSPSPPF